MQILLETNKGWFGKKSLLDDGKIVFLTDIRTKNKFEPFVSQHEEKH